jgi:hypothetical protein
MSNNDSTESLAESGDEITKFVTTNRAVYDAVESMLHGAHRMLASNELAFPNEPDTRHVKLVGGRDQLDVLVSLASENGLGVQFPPVNNELVLDAIGFPLSLVVTCDLGADELESALEQHLQPGLGL